MMKTFQRAAWVVPGLILLGSLNLWAQSPPVEGEGEKAPSLKIGFANIKDIIDQYKRTKTREGEIDRYREEETDKIEKRRKEIKDLKDEIKMLDPRSRIAREKLKRIRRMEMEIQVAEEELKYELQHQLLQATMEIYEDITRHIKKYAEANGFSVIFKVETGEFESESKAELILKINSRGVLFYDVKLDITEAIVKIMNKEYTGEEVGKEGEKKEGENKEGENKEGENKEGENKEGVGGGKPPGEEGGSSAEEGNKEGEGGEKKN